MRRSFGWLLGCTIFITPAFAGQICDYQQQCYDSGGTRSSVVQPTPTVTPALRNTTVNNYDPLVEAWRVCMANAMQTYNRLHDLTILQYSSSNCQNRFDPRRNTPIVPSAPPGSNTRRDIGCGSWPIGSDADRDCLSGHWNSRN